MTTTPSTSLTATPDEIIAALRDSRQRSGDLRQGAIAGIPRLDADGTIGIYQELWMPGWDSFDRYAQIVRDAAGRWRWNADRLSGSKARELPAALAGLVEPACEHVWEAGETEPSGWLWYACACGARRRHHVDSRPLPLPDDGGEYGAGVMEALTNGR